jgi:hypothetical protein
VIFFFASLLISGIREGADDQFFLAAAGRSVAGVFVRDVLRRSVLGGYADFRRLVQTDRA